MVISTLKMPDIKRSQNNFLISGCSSYTWCYHPLFQGAYLGVSMLLERQQKEIEIRSVQFSRSVVSNSLLPHELQHARPPVLIPWDIMQSSEKSEGQEVSSDSTPDYYKMK